LSLQALLAQKSDELATRRAALKAHADLATSLPADKVWDHVKAMEPMEKELADLNDQVGSLQERVEAQKRNDEALKAMRDPIGRQTTSQATSPDEDDADAALAAKSMRQILRESPYAAALKAGTAGTYRGPLGSISYKTLVTTSNGAIPAADRQPMVPYAVEERTTADLMLQGTTSSGSVEYYEETTFTNSAAEATEGTGAKGESALAFTLRTEPVRTIATWIPVTTQMMEDGEQFESYLRERLAFMVRRREETQILVGDGTAPNISGIQDRSIQTQAKGADPTPDAVYKAMTKVRSTGFAEPTAAVFHPNDWQDIRLLRTVDGVYIWGAPSDAGPERIWGLQVRQTTAQTENTGLVGAFRPYAQIFRRTGIELAVSDSHSDYFIYNKLAVRAEERIALAVYRPYAFCTVTGI
jgi:HK97 family phage major capsid protein